MRASIGCGQEMEWPDKSSAAIILGQTMDGPVADSYLVSGAEGAFVVREDMKFWESSPTNVANPADSPTTMTCSALVARRNGSRRFHTGDVAAAPMPTRPNATNRTPRKIAIRSWIITGFRIEISGGSKVVARAAHGRRVTSTSTRVPARPARAAAAAKMITQ